MSARIRVDLRERGYDVVVGRGLLGHLADAVPLPAGARRAAVVTQRPVAVHHLEPVVASLQGAGLQVSVHEVPDGEAAKSLDQLGALYRAMAALPLARGDVVVALGGGVVGDLAGFLAATWNRGVAVLQAPTTLLAQVDAAIGGKTAVNLAEGKNLVGAFHQPLGVVADVDTLATLPARERTAGLGEVVKYGLIRDPGILDLLADDPDAATTGDPDLLTELVRRSAAVKAAVVAADERETGERAHLNLGHTYGHAVEALTGYGRYLHGEAVAIGTVLALRLGVALGHTHPTLAARGEALLGALGLPTAGPVLDRAEVWRTMGRDKKVRDGVRFVLLDALASPTVITPPTDAVDAAIDTVEQDDTPSPRPETPRG